MAKKNINPNLNVRPYKIFMTSSYSGTILKMLIRVKMQMQTQMQNLGHQYNSPTIHTRSSPFVKSGNAKAAKTGHKLRAVNSKVCPVLNGLTPVHNYFKVCFSRQTLRVPKCMAPAGQRCPFSHSCVACGRDHAAADHANFPGSMDAFP